jgi:hypothetical protein
MTTFEMDLRARPLAPAPIAGIAQNAAPSRARRRPAKKGTKHVATPAPKPAAAAHGRPAPRPPVDEDPAVARALESAQQRASFGQQVALQLAQTAAADASEIIASLSGNARLATQLFTDQWEAAFGGPAPSTAEERSSHVREAASWDPLTFCKAVAALPKATVLKGASKNVKPVREQVLAAVKEAVAAVDDADHAASPAALALAALREISKKINNQGPEIGNQTPEGAEPRFAATRDNVTSSESDSESADPRVISINRAVDAIVDARANGAREGGIEKLREAADTADLDDATRKRKKKGPKAKKASRKRNKQAREAEGVAADDATGHRDVADAEYRVDGVARAAETDDAVEAARQQRLFDLRRLAGDAQQAVNLAPIPADIRPVARDDQLGKQMYPEVEGHGQPPVRQITAFQVSRAPVTEQPTSDVYMPAGIVPAGSAPACFKPGYRDPFSDYTKVGTRLLADRFRDGSGRPVAGHTERVMARFHKMRALYETTRREGYLDQTMNKGFAAWEMACVLFAAQPPRGSGGSGSFIDVLVEEVHQMGQAPTLLDIPKCVRDVEILSAWIDAACDLCGDGEGSEEAQMLYTFSEVIIRPWRLRCEDKGSAWATECQAVADRGRHGAVDPLRASVPPTVSTARPAAKAAKAKATGDEARIKALEAKIAALSKQDKTGPKASKPAKAGKPAGDAGPALTFGDRTFTNNKICRFWAKEAFEGASPCKRENCGYDHFGMENGKKVYA